jgi:hypothetical protein
MGATTTSGVRLAQAILRALPQRLSRASRILGAPLTLVTPGRTNYRGRNSIGTQLCLELRRRSDNVPHAWIFYGW